MMIVIPYVGVLSDRKGPRTVATFANLGLAIWAVPAIKLFETGDPMFIGIGGIVGLILVGFSLASLAPWYAEMYDVKTRYTGAGLTYMFTGVFGSGLSAIIVPSLSSVSGTMGVSGYLIACAVAGLIALSVARNSPRYTLSSGPSRGRLGSRAFE